MLRRQRDPCYDPRMRRRRALLTLGFGLLLASAGRYVGAADQSISAEGDLHAGTSTGGWICGPLAQARYAGGGAQVHPVGRGDLATAYLPGAGAF